MIARAILSGAMGLAALSVALLAARPGEAIVAPNIPTYTPVTKSIWLDQGWSDDQRQWFHHASQGTDTLPIPYAWFLALERPQLSLGSPGLLSDGAYLDRFGFISSPKSVDNPDGLPIGFTRTAATDPSTGAAFDHVGFTCAACHTGRLDYKGTGILIDGGPAMTDVGTFRKAVANAILLTAKLPDRLHRFAGRVLGPGYSLKQLLQLKIALDRTVVQGLGMQLAHAGEKASLTEGFGRIDALNSIGNEVFSDQMKIKANYAPLTAPVAYPHIWGTAWFDWVQYNSSIEQPMVRNAGEAMGVRALVNYGTGPTPRFTSTVPIDQLAKIEELLAGKDQPTDGSRFTGLRAPRWPAALPPINTPMAAAGAKLYTQYCSSCHLAPVDSPAFWQSSAWLPVNGDGKRFLRPVVTAVDDIGTDEAQAVDMKNRTVRVPLSYGLKTAPVSVTGTIGIYPYGPALGDVVEKVVNQWYDTRTPPVPNDARNRMNGFRANGIRDGLPGKDGKTVPVYKARPLDGIWATAPFLHNGSVPTLYDLLSPFAERPKTVWLGNREFDPFRVGYVNTRIAGSFALVTADAHTGKPVRGNGNGGHLFETPAPGAKARPGTLGPTLTPTQRLQLVEYLKTL